MVAFPKMQADGVADYLATNFPEKPAPAAVLIPGSTSVSIRECPWLSGPVRPGHRARSANGPLLVGASPNHIAWRLWATFLGSESHRLCHFLRGRIAR